MGKQLKSYSSVEDARAFAAFAYFGLEDKAGLDYLAHPVRVWETVKRRGGVPYIQVGALFHDILEDTVITPQHLLDLGFHQDAVEVTQLVTRGPHTGPCSVVDLCDGCTGYYLTIAGHPGALMIKDADIDDNSDETRLSYLPPRVQRKSRLKYAHGREIMHGIDCVHVGIDLDTYLKGE